LKFATVSEALAASGLALFMEAARTLEMLVTFYHTTLRHNPQDSHLSVLQLFETACLKYTEEK
jgi:hypothetical protein